MFYSLSNNHSTTGTTVNGIANFNGQVKNEKQTHILPSLGTLHKGLYNSNNATLLSKYISSSGLNINFLSNSLNNNFYQTKLNSSFDFFALRVLTHDINLPNTSIKKKLFMYGEVDYLGLNNYTFLSTLKSSTQNLNNIYSISRKSKFPLFFDFNIDQNLLMSKQQR
jgi:hypothetical protein